MKMRIRFKKLGGHIHCRVFTAKTPDGTFAKCGDLVFDEKEWQDIARLFRNAEFVEDEA
jgi:hypothetical protein